jgi:regulator of protease activity HflC (stomatin/prohibitin superfamily)
MLGIWSAMIDPGFYWVKSRTRGGVIVIGAKYSPSRESGKVSRTLLATLVLMLVVSTGVWYTFGSVVPPGYIGVRKISIAMPFGLGPQQGYADVGLAPGYHWQIPVYSEILTIPEHVQMLQLHRDQQHSSDSEAALEVQTLNGSSVLVDMTILYRFFSGKDDAHGGPAELLMRVGAENSWKPHISVVANNELIKSLGGLSTADFYDPSLREQKLKTAKDGMNQRLNGDGIAVEAVLLKRYTYEDDKIDDAIFDKNLQERQESFEKASSELTSVQAELRKIEKKWSEDVKTLLVEGESQVQVIRSESDLYESQKIAEGNLLVHQAEAEVNKLRANALASSPGAGIYIATELVPLVSSLRGGVVSKIDPFDLDGWIKRLGFKGLSKFSAQPTGSQAGSALAGEAQ